MAALWSYIKQVHRQTFNIQFIKERWIFYLDTCYQAIWICSIVNKITSHIICKTSSLKADYNFHNLETVVMMQLSRLEHLYLVVHINQPLLL